MTNKVFTDTSDIFAIDYGDIIQVGGKKFIVKGHEREERFGLDEPKFWVKKAVDLETEERKIIKLSFFETFETNIGEIRVQCFRHPEKEGAVLNLVKDHPHFMHGTSYHDEKKNCVRILDIVQGRNLFAYINSLEMEHERYFHEIFPGILKSLIPALHALQFLHTNGFTHGDVRNDHIFIERGTGNYVWIDFDYDHKLVENPFSLDIMGVGNILLYTIGKGFYNMKQTDKGELIYKDLGKIATPEDFSILHKWRFMNLKKLYSYIPDDLNNILSHFTAGAEIFYESVNEIIEDLNECMHLKKL